MARKTRLFPIGALIGAGALTLGVFGTLVGLQVSAGAQSAAPARVPARPVAHLTGTTTLDHFTCYVATAAKNSTGAAGFGQPSAVQLFNQFSPQGLWRSVGNVAFHCNPVQKTALSTPPTVTKITNPNGHLLCFTTPSPPAATVVTQPTYKVLMTNQFGSEVLDTGQPVLLCLPTWKSLTGPPQQTQVQPPGLDHFLCYLATADTNTTSRFAPPPLRAHGQGSEPAGGRPADELQ